MPNVRAIKSDSVSNEPRVDHATLRGVEYAITELDVVQYDECMAAAESPDGTVEFGKLLRAMVMRCVSPSPASFSRPLPFAIYRTLEGRVNTMHYTDVPDETTAPPADDAEEPATPNA